MISVPFNVKNLEITLESSGKKIVDKVSFSIEKGEMLAIVGGSGAGKTTVSKAVMGLLGPEFKVEGEITYKGTQLLGKPRKKLLDIYGNDICLIMQNPMVAFNPSIKIGKQIKKTYVQHHGKISKEAFLMKCEEGFERMGLTDCERILRSYPFALSGGMLQRIMIATALMNNPSVLVADEATTAIDACNRITLMEELKALNKEGMAVLFITHDFRAAEYSDKMLIMNKGSTVEYGRTKEILSHPKKKYTRELLNACWLERRRQA